MRRQVQKNKNKQKQELKNRKLKDKVSIFNSDEAYMNITLINLSAKVDRSSNGCIDNDAHIDSRMLLDDLKLSYNYILRDATYLNNHELTYLVRASDLVILAITSVDVDHEILSLIKRSMPTILIVHDKKFRNVAKAISKSFGSVKTCDFSMVNMILNKIETSCTATAQSRPYMVAKDVQFEGDSVVVKGFMKSPLKSDKVIINGIHEGIIEQVFFDDQVISGDQLNGEENLQNLDFSMAETADDNENDLVEEDGPSEQSEVECEEESLLSEDDLDLDVEEDQNNQMDPKYDLITRYSEYRGIRNLANCTFKDQQKPEHYKDIVFIKNKKYALAQIQKRESPIPKNKMVTLKIKIFEPINERIFVMFNLLDYETRKTIYNYDFSTYGRIPKMITVDNGYRIFNTNCCVTRNLNNNLFKIEPGLDTGVVSFIGPVNFFDTTAFLLYPGKNQNKNRPDTEITNQNDNADVSTEEEIIEQDTELASTFYNNLQTIRAVSLLNGQSKDRIFFECVTLKGKPAKICKSYVVVRGMFFNKEQVEYFRNIKVETRNGVTGFIKKPLGTKGLFKAYFSQQVKHGDYITMNLYKRVFL